MAERKKNFQNGSSGVPDQDAAFAALTPQQQAWIREKQKKAELDPKIVRTQPWEKQSPRNKPPDRPAQTPRQTGRPQPEKFQRPSRRTDDGK